MDDGSSSAVRRSSSACQCRVIAWAAIAMMVALPRVVVASDRYRFDQFNTDNGLPQNSVLSIGQTRDGYLWFATTDGLVRFDGVRFTVINRGSAPTLRTNRFTSMLESEDGTLWLGTETEGVTAFRNGMAETFGVAVGLPHDWVWALREDSSGALVALTAAGVARLAGGRFVALGQADGFPETPYRFEHRFGGLSFVDQGTLHRFDRGRFRASDFADRLSAADFASMSEDQYRSLWLVTDDRRLLRHRPDEGLVAVATDLPYRDVSAVLGDRAGNIWIASGRGSLVRLANGVMTTVRPEQSPPAGRIVVLYEDREGLIWLGTQSEGVYRMSRQAVDVLGESEGLSPSNVYPLLESRDGSVWIGTWCGGVARYKDGAFKRYTRADGLLNNCISMLYEDRDGTVWIGSRATGVNRFEQGRITTFDPFGPIARDVVRAVAHDRAGAFWFGTPQGLLQYENGALIRQFTEADGLPDPDIRVIYASRSGVLWLGTPKGLARFDRGRITAYTQREGLSSNLVRSIHEEQDGTLWVGTYDGGLNRLKDGKLMSFTTRNGLYNDGVFQILDDDHGDFWMSSNLGIFRVRKQDLHDLAAGAVGALQSVAYGKRDGLLTVECNGGANPPGIKTRDGRLWFPTQAGVARIDAAALPRNTLPPPVIIETVTVDGQPSASADDIRVQPGRSTLQIRYTAPSFVRAEQVRFRYRLEGLDPDWLEGGTSRTVSYSHLPPGRYGFTVIAANSDGVWNTTGASVRFVVVPPIWRTWWFSSLAAVALLGLVLAVAERRVARMRDRHVAQQTFSQQLIESQEHERERIASELHDGLGQTLLVIRNRALSGLQRGRNDEHAVQRLHDISDAALEALDEIRTTAADLHPYHIDRLGLTKAIAAMVTRLADASGIAFTTELEDIDQEFSPAMVVHIYRIVQEGLNNIVKHSGAASARVAIRRSAGQVHVVISDTGQGFARTADAAKGAGFGFGLHGVAERVRIVGGTFAIDTARGTGTTLEVTLRPGDRHGS